MAAKVTPFKRPHFFTIDNDFIDVHAAKLGPTASMIYMVLKRHEGQQTHQCWPSIATIARLVGVCVSSVQRHMSHLVKAGLTTSEPRRDEAGDPSSNLYTLLDPSPAAVEKRLQEQEIKTREGVVADCDHPPMQTDTRGGSTLTDELDVFSEQHEKNEEKLAHAEQKDEETTTVRRPERQVCLHPVEERIAPNGIAICLHCFQPVDEAATPEEGQAHAVCAA